MKVIHLLLGMLLLALVASAAWWLVNRIYLPKPRADQPALSEPTAAATNVPLYIQFGFPTPVTPLPTLTPTPTPHPAYVEFIQIQQLIHQIMGTANEKLAPVGSIEGDRCQGQSHDMTLFSTSKGEPYAIMNINGFRYSKYAYVLDVVGTLHMCTETGELIY